MEEMKTTASSLIEAIKESEQKKTSGYDTTAEVIRIDGQTAWVHIPGGVDETPVALTISAEVGDTVQIRVAGGSAWITGNRSKPPTDDTKAVEAKGVADVAQVKAASAQETAESAEEIAKDASRAVKSTNQYFWHTETDTGAGAGAHITEVPQEDFIADPANGGGNLLAQSDGIAVRDGLTELATFGASGAVIGQNASGKARTEIGTAGMQIIQNTNGTDTQIANLGYAYGSNSGGATEEKPFFTFGKRKTGEPYNDDPEEAYYYGDVAEHNGVQYFCIAITSGAWDSTKWIPAIGNYSVAEGFNTVAAGAYSHAENATATGYQSHAESGHAAGAFSHTDCGAAVALGDYSHATGELTAAKGRASFAAGLDTEALGDNQVVIGKYNYMTDANKNNFAFVIGNGTFDPWVPSNALTVDWSGNVEASGSITAGGYPSGLYAAEVLLADNITISGQTYGNGSKSVAKTGYTPIAIAGMHLQNASTGGQNNTTCAMHSWYLSGTTAYWIVRGTTTATAKIKVTATILYVKS